MFSHRKTYCKLCVLCVTICKWLGNIREWQWSLWGHRWQWQQQYIHPTINPINGHTGNIEEVNMEEQIQGEFQEKNKEEQEQINFIRWFSLILLYNLSNNLFKCYLFHFSPILPFALSDISKNNWWHWDYFKFGSAQ